MPRMSSMIAIGVVVLSLVGCGKSPQQDNADPLQDNADPLPSLNTIKTMKASFIDRDSNLNVTFDVPQSQWDSIYAALLPAKRDHKAAKWEVLGQVEITHKDDQHFSIQLYFTGGSGAFSAGETFEKRVYYRGGNSKKLEKAIEKAWAEAKKVWPDRVTVDPDSYRIRGQIWLDKGEFDKAIQELNTAIKLQPKKPVAYHLRAEAWVAKGNHDKALADFSEAIRHSTDKSFYLHERGLYWVGRGEYDKALSDIDQAITVDTLHTFIFADRAGLLVRKRQYGKAIADYERVIRFDDSHWESQCGLAMLLASCPQREHRDGTKGLKHARKSCELTKWRNPRALEAFAAASAENGDFSAAVKWQNKAIGFAQGKQKVLANRRLETYKAGKPYRMD